MEFLLKRLRKPNFSELIALTALIVSGTVAFGWLFPRYEVYLFSSVFLKYSAASKSNSAEKQPPKVNFGLDVQYTFYNQGNRDFALLGLFAMQYHVEDVTEEGFDCDDPTNEGSHLNYSNGRKSPGFRNGLVVPASGDGSIAIKLSGWLNENFRIFGENEVHTIICMNHVIFWPSLGRTDDTNYLKIVIDGNAENHSRDIQSFKYSYSGVFSNFDKILGISPPQLN